MQAARISLIYGFCADHLLYNLRSDVLQKFDEGTAGSFSFVSAHKGSILSPVNDINGICAKNLPNVQKHGLEAYLIYETDRAAPEELLDVASRLHADAKACGVWFCSINLIWLMDERHHQDYQQIYRTFAAAHFDRIFLLSDKRSDMSISQELRPVGIALLIGYLAVCGQDRVAAGIYTIGASKLQITVPEIRAYAQHRLARAIMDNRLTHNEIPTVDARVKECLGGRDNWLVTLMAKLGQYVEEHFFYFEGQMMASSDMPDERELCALIRTTILEPWQRKLLDMLCQSPFIDDALVYFEPEAGGCRRLAEELERYCMMDIRPPLKPPVFSGKRDIVDAYNRFCTQHRQQMQLMVRMFVKTWREQCRQMKPLLLKLKQQRDTYASRWLSEEIFLTQCRNTYDHLTDDIDRRVSQLSFDSLQVNDFLSVGENEDCAANWAAYFDSTIESITEINNGRIIDEFRSKDEQQLRQTFTTTLDAEAKLVKMCCAHNHFDDLAWKHIYYLPLGVGTVNEHGNDAEYLRVDTARYQNIEKLVLARLGTFDSYDPLQDLTVFTTPLIPPQPKMIDTVGTAMGTHSLQPKPDKEETEAAKPDWGLAVNRDGARFMLSFTWMDPHIDTLKLKVSGPGAERLELGTINQSAFLNYGSRVDITRYIQYGLQTITLESARGQIGKCEFAHRYTVTLEDELSSFAIGDIPFVKHELKVQHCEATGGQSLDEQLSRNLMIALSAERSLSLPPPQLRKKQHCWTFVTDPNATVQIYPGPPFDALYQFIR